MAIINSNGILTLQNDGPYSWSDVVSAAGNDIEFVDGVYVVDIEIQVVDCTLNILDANIILSKPMTTTDSGAGIINFGQLLQDSNGKEYAANGCNLVINSTTLTMLGYYLTSAGKVRTEPEVNLYDTAIRCEVTSSRCTISFSASVNSTFSRSSLSGKQRVIAEIQNDGILKRSRFVGLHSILLNGNLSVFEDVDAVNCINNFRVASPDTIVTATKMNSIESVNSDFGMLNSAVNSTFRLINSQIDIARSSTGDASQKRYKAVTLDLSFADESGPIENALISVFGSNADNSANIDFLATTDSNGQIATITADIQSSQGLDNLLTTDHSLYVISVSSFKHCNHFEQRTLTAPVGHGPTSPSVTVLKLDPLITSTEEQVQALTSINNSEDAYNALKLLRRATPSAVPDFSRQGRQLIVDALIILDPNATSVISFENGAYTFRSNRFIGGISADVILMNGASIEGGDYGTVVLENGFNGSATFNNVTIGNLVNNTGEDMITNVLTTSTLPMPCLEAQ